MENRMSVWAHYMGLSEFISSLLTQYFTKENEKDKIGREEEYYKYLSGIIDKIEKNEKLSEFDQKIYSEDKIKNIITSNDFIKRDIDRTFYLDFFTKEGGKEQLKNVLERMCAVPGNVGYCQGMNFIVGSMLYLFKNEVKTLYIFSNLYQINYYVKKYIPSVFYHFKNNFLSFDMIYSRWLLTLFANYLEITRLDFPWTCLFIDKWKGLIKLCLILIYELKDQLLKCDMEKLSNLLKEDTFNYHNNYMRSYFLYQKKFKVSNKKLKELRNEYFIDLAKKKLVETNGEVDQWEEEQKKPLNDYLENKNKLEAESEAKIELFKKLNEDANKKYLIAFRQYNTYMKSVRLFQEEIDKVATEKYEMDKILSHYDKIIKEIDNQKNEKEDGKKLTKEKIKENKAKKAMLTKEKNKILEKYGPVKKEFDLKTDLLYKKCDTIDKYKTELDKWDAQKNKIKNELQKYIFNVEEQNKQFIQILSDNLKLSENYKKTYKF